MTGDATVGWLTLSFPRKSLLWGGLQMAPVTVLLWVMWDMWFFGPFDHIG